MYSKFWLLVGVFLGMGICYFQVEAKGGAVGMVHCSLGDELCGKIVPVVDANAFVNYLNQLMNTPDGSYVSTNLGQTYAVTRTVGIENINVVSDNWSKAVVTIGVAGFFENIYQFCRIDSLLSVCWPPSNNIMESSISIGVSLPDKHFIKIHGNLYCKSGNSESLYGVDSAQINCSIEDMRVEQTVAGVPKEIIKFVATGERVRLNAPINPQIITRVPR